MPGRRRVYLQFDKKRGRVGRSEQNLCATGLPPRRSQ